MSNEAAARYVIAWALAKIPYFAAYAWFAFRVLSRAITRARRKRHAALVWIRRWFLALYAVAGLIYLNFLFFVFGLPAAPDPDVVSALLLAAAIFSVAYFVIFNRQILDARVERTGDDDELRELGRCALAWLEAERPYLEPDFSLAQFASALRVDEGRLSKALAEQYDGGFLELVNTKRIAAYEQFLNDPTNNERTILELAFDAGFNSKATFYRIFKTEKGITPTAYRKHLTAKTHNSGSHPAR